MARRGRAVEAGRGRHGQRGRPVETGAGGGRQRQRGFAARRGRWRQVKVGTGRGRRQRRDFATCRVAEPFCKRLHRPSACGRRVRKRRRGGTQ